MRVLENTSFRTPAHPSRSDSGLLPSAAVLPQSLMRAIFPLLVVFTLMLMAAPARALETVIVQLNWKHQFEFAGFYAAIEQGYYREQGLEVRVREGGPGINTVAEVVAGRADFGVGNSSLVIERQRGKPVVAIAALMQHSAIAILARRDHGIENVTDLIGKSIACASHSCDEITAYLNASGVKSEQVKLIDHQNWGLTDLRAGTLDATEVYSTNEPYWVSGEAQKYILLTPRSAGIDLYGNVLFTAEATASANPELVRRFRTATLQGLTYAMANREAMATLIFERYNTQAKVREHLLFEAERLHDVMRLDLVDAGYMSPTRWAHVRDVYARLGMLPADASLDDFIYDPAPPAFSPWLVRLGIVLVVITLLTAVISIAVGRINGRLRREIEIRRIAEAALTRSQTNLRQFVEDANTLLSHELRTPLAAIQIHLDVLRMKLAPHAGSERNLTAIGQAVSRLETLFGSQLTQLFAHSSLVAKGRRLGLADEVVRLTDEFRLLQAGVLIQIQPAEAALGDVLMAPEMLRTMLFNLLENAVKYGAPNVHPTLRMHADNQFATITVANMPAHPLPDNLDQLFTKHSRGNVDDTVPGTGVGLYLVRMIAQAHGGQVGARCDDSGRFTVRVTLPLAPHVPE